MLRVAVCKLQQVAMARDIVGSCRYEFRLVIHYGAVQLSPLMKSNYSNTAQLKDLMTVPPMTAAQHAEVMRKRIAHRRMVEEARDLKKASGTQFDQR